jgi:hypothetical protein
MANIYRLSRPHTDGFITYSEGCQDDVNKCVWSALGWDEKADMRQVLREYARYYLGPEVEEAFADGLLALEQNWQGPVWKNSGIDATLKKFQAAERSASPALKLNWRWQQGLYRAYYDAYVRARLDGKAAPSAAEALQELWKPPAVMDLRARILELAEALFQSVRMQLSVPKYQAIAIERGANLDRIDAPLTDAAYLKRRLAEIQKLPDPAVRVAARTALERRTDPGPGGFYDDLGDPEQQPHLVPGVGAKDDPAFYRTPLVSFAGRGDGPPPTWPRAWWHHVEPLFDAPLQLRYEKLDPAATYRVRAVYVTESRPAKLRLMADERHEIHGYELRPFELLEFPVPHAATSDGTLTLTWTKDPGRGGSGRGAGVAEVWLLKTPPASAKP